MPVVVDTSVAIKWVVTESDTDHAQALLEDYQRRNDPISVPSLFMYEAANVLYALVRGGVFTLPECRQAIRDVFRLVHPLPVDALMASRAVALANTIGTEKTYDTQFLALAERLGCALWTADGRFQRAVYKKVPNLGVPVQIISEYPA